MSFSCITEYKHCLNHVSSMHSKSVIRTAVLELSGDSTTVLLQISMQNINIIRYRFEEQIS